MNIQSAKLFFSLSASALVWTLGASTCFAHPDHPLEIVSSGSALHYFFQPEHALTLVVFAAVVWWICRAVRGQLAVFVPAKKIVQIEDSRVG